MKAIRIHEFGEPSVLKLETLPDLKPGAGQVVIRHKAIGVNPVDTYIRAGKYGPRTFPLVLGLDAAGVVEAVGPGVSTVKVSERVFIYGSLSGTYAEQSLCEASHVHPLPDSLSFEQGAAIGVAYLTAYYALHLRGEAKPGESILIHGASGGVGTAAVQLALKAGLRVIGTAGSKEGLAYVRSQGVQDVLQYSSPDFSEQVMKLTQNNGVNLILEMLANVNLAQDLKLLAKRSRVVVIGSRGAIEIDPRDAMSRHASILGMSILNASPFELGQCWMALEKAFAEGHLKPVVGKTFPLAQAAQAHQAILNPGPSGAHGKVILLP